MGLFTGFALEGGDLHFGQKDSILETRYPFTFTWCQICIIMWTVDSIEDMLANHCKTRMTCPHHLRACPAKQWIQVQDNRIQVSYKVPRYAYSTIHNAQYIEHQTVCDEKQVASTWCYLLKWMKEYHRILQMTFIITYKSTAKYLHIKLLTLQWQTTQPFQVRVPIRMDQVFRKTDCVLSSPKIAHGEPYHFL